MSRTTTRTPARPPAGSFTDASDRQWEVGFTPAMLAAFRAATGADLAAALHAGDTPHALFEEPERLVVLLWFACENQAAARGLSPEAFGRTVFIRQRDGDGGHTFRAETFRAAAVAVFRALAAVYPDTPFARWVRATGGRKNTRRAGSR